MLILGIPAVWLLRKWNFNSVLAYAILGGILPALAYTLAVISFWPASENEAEKMLSSLAIFVMFGIITAVSYWYIAKPNRA